MTLHSEHDGRDRSGERLVLVHGFGQTGRCWGPVAEDVARDRHLVRVDAPGHGSSSQVHTDLPETAALLAKTGGPAVYVGYSMGGRMALHVALDHLEVVRGLVLIGATPGIEDDKERADRRVRDLQLAQRLREAGDDGLAGFISDWLSQPLFAGLPSWARFESERRRNTAEGLASSLELTGTGNQRPRWADLPQLDMPVLLVAGVADTRYATIATRMAHLIGPNADVALIPHAGHAAHLEQPDTMLAVIRTWLNRAFSES